jgi:hypothetical protein
MSEPRESTVPDQSLNMPENHHSVPRLQFPCRILPRNPFLLPYRFLKEQILDRARAVIIQPHKP